MVHGQDMKAKGIVHESELKGNGTWTGHEIQRYMNWRLREMVHGKDARSERKGKFILREWKECMARTVRKVFMYRNIR